MSRSVKCIAFLVAALVAPALAQAGVAYTESAPSPLSVGSDEITYSLNEELGVAAIMPVSSGLPAPGSGGLNSYDVGSMAAMGAAGGFEFTPSPAAPPPGGNPVPGPAPIKGDVNLDNVVDLLDWLTVQAFFGQFVGVRTKGDLNGDNFVDILDWLEVQAHFGDYLIPEPTSLAVFGGCCGLGLLLARRKRRAAKNSNA